MTLIHQIRTLLFNALQLTHPLLENTTDILKAGQTLSRSLGTFHTVLLNILKMCHRKWMISKILQVCFKKTDNRWQQTNCKKVKDIMYILYLHTQNTTRLQCSKYQRNSVKRNSRFSGLPTLQY